MFDELQLLFDDSRLFQLLDHYGQLGLADRTVWHDRLMEMGHVSRHDLTRLHGELIAWGWLEQNTGNTAVLKPGAVANCYRITAQGVKAIKRVKDGQSTEEDQQPRSLAA